PAAAQERRLHAPDAGAAAAAEGHPGSVRELESDRSRQAEDEYGGDEPLSREGRQPGKRLRADAADDAGADCVLRAARPGHRAARRAIRLLDQGPVAARPLLRDP